MFHKLAYSVTFPSTGRTLSNDLELKSGFWAITGPNEAGKSFIFEMIRFLLFGTQALRGKADDYKTLVASGEFTLRGERYAVERTTKKAELKRGSEVIATGVTPVNDKIVRLLGYGMAVFDMAQSINQGEVERLGAMSPAERKRLIDTLIGMDALEVVAKWGMEEARFLERDAETIRRTLTAPVKPTEPAGYRLVSDLEPEIASLREQAHELSEINGFLAVERAKPAKPSCNVDLPAANLALFAQKRRDLRNKVHELKARLAALPESITYSEAQLIDAEAEWVRWDRSTAALSWLSANPAPQYPLMTLKVFEDDWTARENIGRRAALADRIAALQAKGSKPCPHCGEDVPLEQEAIERLQAEHDAIVVPKHDFTPPPPPLTREQIAGERHRLASFDEAKHREMSGVEKLSTPPIIAREQIEVQRARIKQFAEREPLLVELTKVEAEFDKMPDYEAMLAEREAYERALPVYQTELAAFEMWNSQRQQKAMRRDALLGVPNQLAALEGLAHLCRAYEADLGRFARDWDAYEQRSAEADDMEARAKNFRKVREVMNVLRSLIKQHLLPSLNKVASHLLYGMTGGQRQAIYVDEDFNVVVDQQPLDTLSGSGKACANLALRIALGQVLTNRVMSMLLADEIDASMDDFRSEQTSEVLRTLEDSISQVLLVSHKSIEAENEILLGGFNSEHQCALS